MYAPIPSEGSTKGTIYASDNHCSAPYVLTVRDACIDHGPAYGPSGRTDTWHILRARGTLNTRANVDTNVGRQSGTMLHAVPNSRKAVCFL